MILTNTTFEMSMVGYITVHVSMQCTSQREADDILRALQLMSSHTTSNSSSPLVERTRSGEIRPATPTETQIITHTNPHTNPIRARSIASSQRVERSIDDGVRDLNDNTPTEFIDRPVRAAFVFNEHGEMVSGDTMNSQPINNVNELEITEEGDDNVADTDHNYQTDIDL